MSVGSVEDGAMTYSHLNPFCAHRLQVPLVSLKLQRTFSRINRVLNGLQAVLTLLWWHWVHTSRARCMTVELTSAKGGVPANVGSAMGASAEFCRFSLEE
jgi:hypothetical protein